MKLAVVSMTFNDGFKLKEWREHYDEYKKDVSHFVIVDNGSEPEYVAELKATFPDAHIIERGDNGGCTAAYNDGIKYILENTEDEAIGIIANDIKLTPNCLTAMYEYLYSDTALGIVSCAILNINSNIIDNFGHNVKGFNVNNCMNGQSIESIADGEKRKYTELVSGGLTLAKREFYEKAGLQDEKLFMYCDEMDTRYKAIAAGYKLGVIADEYAWHWHINNPKIGKRSSASRYLISRNRVYLANKYEGLWMILVQLFRGLVISPIAFFVHFLKGGGKESLKDAGYSFIGAWHGLLGKMTRSHYTEF